MKSATIAAILGLVLVIGLAAPVAAASPAGTITWDKSYAGIGERPGYTWTASGLTYVNVTMEYPDGTVNITSTLATSGSNTYPITQNGAWTVFLTCAGNTTLLGSDTLTVTPIYGLVSLIDGLIGVVGGFVSLIISVAPILIIFAIIGFVLVFLDRIVERIHL
jgi:hypothetical protein